MHSLTLESGHYVSAEETRRATNAAAVLWVANVAMLASLLLWASGVGLGA